MNAEAHQIRPNVRKVAPRAALMLRKMQIRIMTGYGMTAFGCWTLAGVRFWRTEH
jgi:hypothetical protein